MDCQPMDVDKTIWELQLTNDELERQLYKLKCEVEIVVSTSVMKREYHEKYVVSPMVRKLEKADQKDA